MTREPLPYFSDPTIPMIEKIDKIHSIFSNEIEKFILGHGTKPDGLAIASDTLFMLNHDPRFTQSIEAKEDSYMGIKVYRALNVPYDYIQCFISENNDK